MTTDLTMLVATAVLYVLLVVPYTGARFFGWDYRWVAGNRELPPEDLPWVARAERAHRNTLENIAPFAILVLVAHVTSQANDLTADGAVIFFWARVAYAVTYILGIIYVRTFCWLLGVAGMVMILTQLF